MWEEKVTGKIAAYSRSQSDSTVQGRQEQRSMNDTSLRYSKTPDMGDPLKHLELPEEAAGPNVEVFTVENLLPAFTHGRRFHSGLECSSLKHEEPLCT